MDLDFALALEQMMMMGKAHRLYLHIPTHLPMFLLVLYHILVLPHLGSGPAEHQCTRPVTFLLVSFHSKGVEVHLASTLFLHHLQGLLDVLDLALLKMMMNHRSFLQSLLKSRQPGRMLLLERLVPDLLPILTRLLR